VLKHVHRTLGAAIGSAVPRETFESPHKGREGGGAEGRDEVAVGGLQVISCVAQRPHHISP